jgi:hypothetical protein
MLEMQTGVRNETAAMDSLVRGAADEKARSGDRQVLVKLAKDEKNLVVEATRALGVLESEEAEVAIREVCRQLREDMKRVQRRLEKGDVGTGTQAIEDDIIDCLREMIASLNRASR